MEQQSKLVSLKEVNYGFSKTEKMFFENLSLDLYTNENVLVIGQNGSGKSTLAKILAGLYVVQSGEVIWFNTKQTLPATMIMQNPDDGLIGPTVKDALVFTLENLDLDRKTMHQRYDDVVTSLQLENLLNQDLIALSGGQKQKVSIACSLLTNADLFILDETNSMLDQHEKNVFSEVVYHLQHDLHKTIFNVSHDLRDIYLADRIFYLDQSHHLTIFNKEQLQNLIVLLQKDFELPELMYLNYRLNNSLLNNFEQTIKVLLKQLKNDSN